MTALMSALRSRIIAGVVTSLAAPALASPPAPPNARPAAPPISGITADLGEVAWEIRRVSHHEIIPLIVTEQAKLTIADGEALDQFGSSVAISGDTAVVGAPGRGSAFVFVRSGTLWSQQAILTAGDASTVDTFGWAVALSGDTALVGAYADDATPGGGEGSAYVYVRSSAVWSQEAKLTASDAGTYDAFGAAVALDGDTALVGAPNDDGLGGGTNGSTYVFVRSGTVWTQQAKLTAADPAKNDWFGGAVALSGDTALIGKAGGDNGVPGSDQGSAYVFVRGANDVWDNGSFDQQARLTAADAAVGDAFGYSVALRGDTALVGAMEDDGPAGAGQGSVYVFVRGENDVWDSGSLDEQAKLTAGDATANGLFGRSVALEGDMALVGAIGDEAYQGSAYVFTRSGIVWSQQAKLTASDAAADDFFGYSVGLSVKTALVGAIGDEGYQGSAYVFAFVGCVTPADCPDDGNACTTETCADNVCGVTSNTLPCDDGDACTQTDTCQGGSCVGSDPVVCTALDQCHDAGICNATTGICTAPPLPDGSACNDGNVCTIDDSCSAGACMGGPAVEGTACNDGNSCTTNDTCVAGACVGGNQVDCDDENECTVDQCEEGPTAEELEAFDACCCLPDVPAPAECFVFDLDRDGDVDLRDREAFIASSLHCAHIPNNGSCDDGDSCTADDVCSVGVCIGGPPVNCDDGNVCTEDSCDPDTGCEHVDNTAPCDDGDGCTTADACSMGVCVGGPPLDCDDGNVCTIDDCFNGSCWYAVIDPCCPPLGPCACSSEDECDFGFCCNLSTGFCQPPPCAIPTVSQWGLVVMSLLLLIGAKTHSARRTDGRRPANAGP